MIKTPFYFEEQFTPEEFQKVGVLSLRWSHIDHLIGNSLKAMLGITDEQAIIMIFPISTDNRLNAIADLSEMPHVSQNIKDLVNELRPVMRAIQYVRNTVIHAVIDVETHDFHLRSKRRSIPKEHVFSTEELTNYAGHVALHLRFAIGGKECLPDFELTPLPEKPVVPQFLLLKFPDLNPTRKAGR